MTTAIVDPSRCPLCGASNQCGATLGLATCWCMEATIPAALIEQVPSAAQGVACVCRACAERGAEEAVKKSPSTEP